jgi:RNA recognition motif-containing protein
MGTKLYVGNLPYQLTTDELSAHFSAAGTVTDVHIVMDRATNRSKGFGFVEMSTPEEAAKAIEMLNGQNLKDRQLRINEARPREERPRM